MKIEHVALYCIDLEAMKCFFEKYFQATSNSQYHNERTGLRSYFLTFPDGDVRLEIMSRPEVTSVDAELMRHGLVHLSFSVGSKERVDQLTAELREAGYVVSSGPRTTGDGYYESVIIAPENVQVEITE